MYHLIFHTLVFTINIYAIWYDQMYVDLPVPEKLQSMPFKARAIFLTFWCLMLQTVYFGIALLNDLIGTNSSASNKVPLIRKIKDTLFSLAFPVALYVGAVFWSLYSIHKDLILPGDVDILFPRWLNHAIHTTIIPFIVFELLFTKRNYPPRHVGISIAFGFILGYMSWINFLYFTQNVWVYPFLDLLNWPIRLVFYSCSITLGLLVYILGEKLNYLVSPSSQTYANGVSKQH